MKAILRDDTVHDERYVTLADAKGYAAAEVAKERERLRGFFREALSDRGVTWPAEVDMLYDRCFAEPYSPDESE